MFQTLPIEFAQVKAGNTSMKLLNEIRQIHDSFSRAKYVNKKVYNDIIISKWI